MSIVMRSRRPYDWARMQKNIEIKALQMIGIDLDSNQGRQSTFGRRDRMTLILARLQAGGQLIVSMVNRSVFRGSSMHPSNTKELLLVLQNATLRVKRKTC